MKLWLGCLVSAASGAIALSYELLWLRSYGFLTQGHPQAFGDLLGAYLGGLAVGAFATRSFCHRSEGPRATRPLFWVGIFLLGANSAGFLLIPGIAELVHRHDLEVSRLLPLFAIVAALLGTTLPLIAHYAVDSDQRAGQGVSYIYVANLVGSTLGTLITGFLLMDWLSLEDLSLALALGGLAVSLALVWAGARMPLTRTLAVLIFGAIALQMGLQKAPLFDRVYERLLYRENLPPSKRFAQIIETRSGVVTVSPSGTVYGNGSYDGIFNVDPRPERDVNRVLRSYLIPALHPDPRSILMIGLGSGSWLQVLANHPRVERILVVEINRGYVEAMRNEPLVANALEDPRVEIIIDDGRRHLNHSDERFDVIVQNTIVFWRANATNLLSHEHLELARRHLREAGLLYLNTTGSIAAQRTVAAHFPYALRYQNMLIASDSPVRFDRARAHSELIEWRIDGEPVLPGVPEPALLASMTDEPLWRGIPTWESRAEILARTSGAAIIHDDNMATEWWAKETYP